MESEFVLQLQPLVNQILDCLKEKCASHPVWLELSGKYGASQDGHRLLLRKDISRKIQDLTQSGQLNLLEDSATALGELDLMNISETPKASIVDISISHCRLAGGFALSKPQCKVGLDLEDAHRISSDIISRVATPVECDEAPDPGHLWVAKESAYKAYKGDYQPKTIVDISAFGWEPLKEGFYLFQFSSPKFENLNGYGISCKQQDLVIGLALVDTRIDEGIS